VTTGVGSLLVTGYCVVVHGQEVQEALNIAAFATVLGMVSTRVGWQVFACIMQLLCMNAPMCIAACCFMVVLAGAFDGQAAVRLQISEGAVCVSMQHLFVVLPHAASSAPAACIIACC
jgi:hypothetical protein